MRKVIRLTSAAVLMFVLCVRMQPAQAVGSVATLTIVSATQGPVGTPVSYKYSSVYQSCAAGVADPKTLQIELMWDQPSQVIGRSPLTLNKTASECDGTVTGTVPQGSQPGDHIATAFLADTANGGAQVSGSTVSAASAFTVPGIPAPAGSGAVAASGDTAVPFSWVAIGALAMLDVLLAAAIVFVLSRSRNGTRRVR
jgi:hypothetical protein